MREASEQQPASEHGAALLLIDMINDLDFPDADDLRRRIVEVVEPAARLREAARAAGLPVIFVNDNYGLWQADADAIVAHCLAGNELIERLRPDAGDYFVVKPAFSGFYATTLPVLLPRIGVNRLILAGVAADICVLFTAADAHMRDYDLWVPRDVVASEREERRDWALEIMSKSMGAEIGGTGEVTLADWLGRGGTGR